MGRSWFILEPKPDQAAALLHTLIVVPGQEAAFEAAAARIAKDTSQRMSLFRIRAAGLLQQAQIELLRYQPQLSYLR